MPLLWFLPLITLSALLDMAPRPVPVRVQTRTAEGNVTGGLYS
jgi:hypothetical protein